jgi:RNA polymerase primary sigma factor
MASNGLHWWFDTIGRIPLLSPAQEIELGTAVQAWLNHPDFPDGCPPAIRRRGQRARERFVAANLRLAVSYVTKRCQRLLKQHQADDLIQAANIGLITAVERFDPTRGYKFSTYAYWWIRQAVNRWVEQNGRVIAIPGSHNQHIYRLGSITRTLELTLNRNPTRAELAAELGVSLKVLEQVIENGRPVRSLDSVVSDDGMELSSTVATYDRSMEDDESDGERQEQARNVLQLISELPEADQLLLRQAWGINEPQLCRAALAKAHGTTIRVIDRRLEQLQNQLRLRSVQMVLVSVEPPPTDPLEVSKQKRRRSADTGLVQLGFDL